MPMINDNRTDCDDYDDCDDVNDDVNGGGDDDDDATFSIKN